MCLTKSLVLYESVSIQSLSSSWRCRGFQPLSYWPLSYQLSPCGCMWLPPPFPVMPLAQYTGLCEGAHYKEQNVCFTPSSRKFKTWGTLCWKPGRESNYLFFSPHYTSHTRVFYKLKILKVLNLVYKALDIGTAFSIKWFHDSPPLPSYTAPAAFWSSLVITPHSFFFSLLCPMHIFAHSSSL